MSEFGPAHGRYAEVYDESGQIHFSLRAIPYLNEVLDRHGWSGRRALDLACGTGTLALAFAMWGWRAFGVDSSEEMLQQARRKAAELELPVEFSRQDMRDFTLPERVDLVTCLYDSLNYLLTTEDLARTFERVHSALAPGGLFVFDVNTRWFYEHPHLGTHYSRGDGLDLVVEGAFDAASGIATSDVVGFIRRGDVYERFAERHVQRAHAREEIAGELHRAGFVVVERLECFGFDPPGPETGKVFWLARPV